jgi:phosphohistidine phosphatase SixA
MPLRTRRPPLAATLVIAALISQGCAVAPSFAPPDRPPAQRAADPLVARLAEGGYVIYVRHGRTDTTYQDKQDRPEWWKSCDPKRHRLLSDDGRAQMLSIGANLRALQVPIAKVVSSEYCRALDSALLMQLMPVTQDAALNYIDAHRYAKHTDAEIFAGLRALLSAKPPSGMNTVLVGHVHGFSPPIDIVFTQLQEAEAAILRPLGDGKFEVVGRVAVERWGLR